MLLVTNTYVADGRGGLRIIDVSDPYYPESVGQLVTPGYAHGVVVKNGLAYIADSDSGLCVVDVSDPAVPVYVCGYDTPIRQVERILLSLLTNSVVSPTLIWGSEL